MATRWMKWNEGTHIFEYSTDGVVFNPLPLDASILTEGTIDSARLPAGLPSTGGTNVFTGTTPIILNSPAPNIVYHESDQAINVRTWQTIADGQIFRIRTTDDALNAVSDVFTINRNGTFNINVTGGAVHNILANTASVNLLNMTNTNAAASAYVGMTLANDAGIQRVFLVLTSSAFATAGFVADAYNLICQGAGGVNISGTALRFKTQATDRLVINSSGAAFSGSISEYGRAFPLGVWNSVAFNAANFGSSGGTWTITSGDQIHYNYTLVGKTFFFDLRIINSSTGASMGTAFYVALPAGLTAPFTSSGVYHLREGAVQEVGLWHVSGPLLHFMRSNYTTAHVSSVTDAVDIRATGFFQIS